MPAVKIRDIRHFSLPMEDKTLDLLLTREYQQMIRRDGTQAEVAFIGVVRRLYSRRAKTHISSMRRLVRTTVGREVNLYGKNSIAFPLETSVMGLVCTIQKRGKEAIEAEFSVTLRKSS